jgi:uncharacterized membrane protein
MKTVLKTGALTLAASLLATTAWASELNIIFDDTNPAYRGEKGGRPKPPAHCAYL